jgi:hypothetical protein
MLLLLLLLVLPHGISKNRCDVKKGGGDKEALIHTG